MTASPPAGRPTSGESFRRQRAGTRTAGALIRLLERLLTAPGPARWP